MSIKIYLKNSYKAKKICVWNCHCGCGIFVVFFLLLSGWSIGRSKYRSSDECFIYNVYKMIYCSVWQVGSMFVGVAIFVSVIFMYIDIQVSRKNFALQCLRTQTFPVTQQSSSNKFALKQQDYASLIRRAKEKLGYKAKSNQTLTTRRL